jgi:crotonobetainyl-CoA:carnitine CoA-transferase CaiB-like acyl-CoA transferase
VKAGIPVTDLGAGLFALAGILAALHYRDRSGHGQHIDTSLGDAGLALSVWEATEYFSGRGVPGPLGSAHRMSAPYQAVRCADGYVTLGAANQRTFEKLAETLGHPEWIVDPRFATDAARVAHRKTLVAAIEAETASAARADWLGRFDRAGLPCGPILDYAEAFETPQARAREMSLEVDHPALGRLRTIGTPIKMSETPLDPGRRAPLLGEHTAEVLAALGYDAEAIARLRGDASD